MGKAEHPGKRLRQLLETQGWTQDQLAAITGKNRQSFAKIIGGATGVSAEMAVALGAAFGNPPQQWLQWGADYELSLIDTPVDAIRQRAKIYGEFPIREMQKRGWISESNDPDRLQLELERFTGESVGSSTHFPIAARKSNEDVELSGPEKAWILRARQLAATILVEPFDSARLGTLVDRLRVLAAYPDEAPKLAPLLREFGIRFVVVEPLPGVRLDGAIFWMGSEPAIAVSTRFDRNDNFWFTILHEVAHIRAGDAYSFDSLSASDDGRFSIGDAEAEAKANGFAADVLVPKRELDSFIKRVSPLYPEVRIVQFANRIKMHPGIILGQLQRREELGYGAHRSLIVKIRQQITSTALTDGWGYSISPKLLTT